MQDTPDISIVCRIASLAREIAAQKEPRLDPNANLVADLGMDSLQFLELIERVEDEFDVALIEQFSDLAELETPLQIAQLVTHRRIGR